MTYEMKYTSYLYARGALGEKALPPERNVDWEKIVNIAVEQSITYTTAMAVKKNALGCPEDIKNRLTASLRGAAVKNSIKTDEILSLVEEMNNSKIKTVIIKGIDAARFYSNPECRVSSDTDLLISPEDESKAMNFLRSKGFQMEERAEDDNHAVGYHPNLGIVEIHVKLLADFYRNAAVKNLRLDERAMKYCEPVSYRGKTYLALETTDNLLFLTHHMMKHLIFNGMSLRMIMDNALFSRFNIQKIDRERYAESLKASGYLHAVQVIFGAAVRYFGFKAEDFPVEPIENKEQIEAVMDDLEDGGWQGQKNEMNRIEAWYFFRTKAARKNDDREQLRAIKKEIKISRLHSLFPSTETLSEKYAGLKNHKWKYPFFWTRRFFTKGIGRLFNGGLNDARDGKNTSQLSETGQKKMELLEILELI